MRIATKKNTGGIKVKRMNGYIALHKKILEWEWYSDINTCRVFIHILLKANWEDKKWRGIQIKRGQWATSIQTICNETSLTPREVRTAIDHLIETGEIDKQATSRYTVITVLNYDSYQISDKPSVITTTAQRQQLNKEIIKENNIYSPPESGESVKESVKEKEQILRENFETLYKYYPRKEGKTKAFEYYRQYVGKGRDINGIRRRLTNQQIYHAILKYAASKEGKDKEYIAHFSTFMNKTILDYVEEPNDTS